jgi:S-DNA-T family DNA segregation ATPase FtsK/SpoIIIE
MKYILKLNEIFKQLKIKAKIKDVKYQGCFLIFDIILHPNGTYGKIERHLVEIALGLKALSVPILYPLMKDGIIKMELIIKEPETVNFNSFINGEKFKNCNYEIPLIIGKDRSGEDLILNLVDMPHLLIGGATGSGKSIFLQSIINGFMKSKNISLCLIDPKRVEFSYYDGLTNLFSPIAKNSNEALELLNNVVDEMDKRFLILEKSKCRSIKEFYGYMPYIVVIIDELADLMMSSKKEAQDLICKIAQKSRACGIHLVVATQRPSVDVITGLIKANFPTRISFKVSSFIDSRVLLDCGGAERLMGNGDAILKTNELVRFKGIYISKEEIQNNIEVKESFWRKIWME